MTAEQLKNSILQEAISGRLVPQDPNDEPAKVIFEETQKERLELLSSKEIRKSDLVVSDLDEEQMFDLPGGWKWTTVDRIAIVKGGKRIPVGKTFSPTPTPYMYIRVTEMKNNTLIDCEHKYISAELRELLKRYIIHSTDIYVTIAGTIGAVGDVPEKFDGMNLTENALKLSHLHMDKKFLIYALSSPFVQEQFKEKTNKVGQPKLAMERVKNTMFPLPPLEEQKRIVAKLEELLPIVEQYGKAQTELDELNAALPARLRQSILQEAISGRLVPQDPNEDAEDVKTIEIEDAPFEIPNNWRWCSLGDLVDMVSGTSYKKDDVRTKGVRILRGGNIVNDELVLAEDDVFLPDEYANLEKNIRKDDIIIVASTGSQKVIGKPALIRQNYDKTQIGAFLRIIRAKDVKYVPFLWLIFKGMYYREHIRNLVKGTNINNIKEEYITTLPIPLPPLAEQKRIVAKIEELFAEIDKMK